MRHSPAGSLAAVVSVVVALLAVVSAGMAAAQTGGSERTGGFDDVPENSFYSEAVAELDEDGVFDDTECDDDGKQFCPDDPIDRKTMAVWIVRMLDGEDPLPTTESRFDDVEGSSFHAPFIERMYHLSVTSGCGDGRGFCPDLSVTRAQMAAFLARGYQLPDGPAPGFGDIAPGAWYATDVARLVGSGITRGCRDGTVFCPEQDTTRAQMAAFLHRGESRNRWARTDGVSEDGRYVEFRASEDQTEVRWRPKGLALTVRCTFSDTEEHELEVSAFGYGRRSWFFGDFGVIEYRFGNEPGSKRIFAGVSDDHNVLIIQDSDEEDFLEDFDDATSDELFLSLFDERADGSFDFEIEGELSIVGYREHVKPLVEACD